jgi:hypothetical protein
VCKVPVCGNGVKEGTEQCDLGASNTGAYGGCNSNCTLAPRCGDGIVNGPEACDTGAGNTGAYGGCNANCTLGPRCGDGIVNGPEACDTGVNNGTNVNQCNPACSGLVQVKRVLFHPQLFSPNFGGVAAADSLCRSGVGAGFKAFLVDGVTRIASVSSFKGDGQIDWVFKAYMQYINVNGSVIATTDKAALIGVSNGVNVALLNPIDPTNDRQHAAWFGGNRDYTSGQDCLHFTSNSANDHDGGLDSADTAPGVFPTNGGLFNCSLTEHIVCVEQ